MCRKSGDAAPPGQGTGRKGGAVQGGCRRRQDDGQRPGRGGGPRGAAVAGGEAEIAPVGEVDATGGTEQAGDPNQQALDEIMEAVRQMEMHPKGTRERGK